MRPTSPLGAAPLDHRSVTRMNRDVEKDRYPTLLPELAFAALEVFLSSSDRIRSFILLKSPSAMIPSSRNFAHTRRRSVGEVGGLVPSPPVPAPSEGGVCSVFPGPTSNPAMPATEAPAIVPRRPIIWFETPSVAASVDAFFTTWLVLLTTDSVTPCCPWACKSAVSPGVCAVPLD